MSEKILLRNCKHYQFPEAETVDVLITDGKIAEIRKQITADENSVKVIDARNLIVAPGFIDIHIQGAGGYDVLDASENALQTISRTLAQFGTTGFLATTVFHTDKTNHHLEITAQMATKKVDGAEILGIHLEGPFINARKKGGISETCITVPDIHKMENIFTACQKKLTMMTLAPELKGIDSIIDFLQRRDVIASFGHSAADYQVTKKSFQTITHVTHLYNAMNPMHHREPGPIPAIFETEHVSAQLIADGVHVHEAIVNLTYREMGVSRIICITDGVQAIGLPEGMYHYNGKKYLSKDGAARYLDGTLIGTAISLNQIVRRFQRFTNCTLEEAIQTATANPAKLLGIENHKGSLKIGFDADIILMDENFEVYLTIIDGKIIFRKSSFGQDI